MDLECESTRQLVALYSGKTVGSWLIHTLDLDIGRCVQIKDGGFGPRGRQKRRAGVGDALIRVGVCALRARPRPK
jgi:hypothetical protein